jgi:hypothetical protein
MAKHEPGTRVLVVAYDGAAAPEDEFDIIGQTGRVGEPPRHHVGTSMTWVQFNFRPGDTRNGGWYFLDDEIEAV